MVSFVRYLLSHTRYFSICVHLPRMNTAVSLRVPMIWSASKSGRISVRCSFLNLRSSGIYLFLIDESLIHRRGCRFTAFSIEMRATFRSVPHLSSLLLKRARATCQAVRTGRPGHSQVAARRGHVHAPYTSLGSGVAVGLKGRYTHHELRWGRPTGSACVGVGDSTPLEAHPCWRLSWGDKKNRETEGDPRRSRRAAGKGETRGGQAVRTKEANLVGLVTVCTLAHNNPPLSFHPASGFFLRCKSSNSRCRELQAVHLNVRSKFKTSSHISLFIMNLTTLRWH